MYCCSGYRITPDQWGTRSNTGVEGLWKDEIRLLDPRQGRTTRHTVIPSLCQDQKAPDLTSTAGMDEAIRANTF